MKYTKKECPQESAVKCLGNMVNLIDCLTGKSAHSMNYRIKLHDVRHSSDYGPYVK